MNYEFRSSQPGESISKEILLAPGINSFCVDKFGQYDLSFASCHTYDANTPKSFQTGVERPVSINAVKHRNGIRILSDIKTSFKVLVEPQNGESRLIAFAEEANKVKNQFAYRYDFDLEQSEKLTITPKSDIVLFTPQSKEIYGGNDCVEVRF